MFEALAEKLRKKREVDVQFKEYDEEPRESVNHEEKEEERPMPQKNAMVAGTGDSESNIELKVVRPETFQEVITVADYLLSGCTVVLNLEMLDAETVKRMLDFLNGVCYSTGGDVKNVSRSTYIITPHNVDISEK
jgi:cell division inhibitor SepF